MSYILDALRKSEQERQIAAGQGVGMLFPTSPEQAPGNGRKFMLLGATALVLTIALNAWLWTRTDKPEKALAMTSQNSKLPPAPPPAASLPPVTPVPPALPAPVALATPTVPAKVQVIEEKPRTLPTAQPEAPPTASRPREIGKPAPPAPAPEKIGKDTADSRPAPNAPASTGKKEETGSPPAAMPPIAIAGYIKDQAGGNLAIINDRLVREGEEIAPGLRLEKIDGENAVFTYKGQRFRR